MFHTKDTEINPTPAFPWEVLAANGIKHPKLKDFGGLRHQDEPSHSV